MLQFPNCKINLGLHILTKREDGFHNIETIFYPIPIIDGLEIITADALQPEITFTQSGNIIDGDANNNLCIKAYHLLKNDFPNLPNIKLHLHKTIPTGAGLGGGSADGAFMLNLLNTKYQLKLSTEQLINYALQLGSDCPFFIINKPCFATGRGELLHPIELNLLAYKIIIVNPGIHINTGWAFSQVETSANNNNLREIIKAPIEKWKEVLTNNFENPVFMKYEEIKNIKNQFYNCGAIYASMSGSGSTVYGIFEKTTIFKNQFPNNYLVKEINL